MSDSKIGEQHRGRKAMLCIRQSSLHQVEHHHESRRLQYAMKQPLESLGWREVDVVDDDLGPSMRIVRDARQRGPATARKSPRCRARQARPAA
jgi:hypothetical protein